MILKKQYRYCASNAHITYNGIVSIVSVMETNDSSYLP